MSGDRGIIVGRAGSGKSTLMAQLIEQFVATYVNPDHFQWRGQKVGRVLVSDTKPRWRAERSVSGGSLSRYYKRQGYVVGDTVRESVLLRTDADWSLAWDPDVSSRIVVAQRSDIDNDAALLAWHSRLIQRFFTSQRPDEPSLLVIDEGMDFFGSSGNSVTGRPIARCYRSGREKGMVSLIGVQRPKCINLQCLTESNVLYLFGIDFDDDVARLREMGLPKGVTAPEEDTVFRFMRGRKLYPSPIRLKGVA